MSNYGNLDNVTNSTSYDIGNPMTDLHDDLLKHQIFVQRLQGTQAETIKDHLNLLKKQAYREIQAGSKGSKLKDNLRSAMSGLTKNSIDNMTDIGTYESKFSAKVFNKHKGALGLKSPVTPVSSDQIAKSLKGDPMSINSQREGPNAPRRSMKTAYDQFSNRKADEVSEVIRKGRLRKLSDGKIAGMVNEKIEGLHTLQAAALAKTTINHTVTNARAETIESNPDMEQNFTWVATLENSCDDCQDHDGESFALDDEQPPIHYNCACHMEPAAPETNPSGDSEQKGSTSNDTINNVDDNQGLDQGE